MLLKCSLIFLHLLCLFDVSKACGCSKLDYKPYSERIKFLSRLPDSKKICDLALIGSYSSLSYNARREEFRTQDLTIKQQLKYGVRFFDIAVTVQLNSFLVYLDDETPGSDLLVKLAEVDDFLNENPYELVIMHLAQRFPYSINVTTGICEILKSYCKNGVGMRFVTNWKLEDTIGKHRGKILLTSLDFAFYECAFSLRIECDINYDFVNRYERSITDLKEKWENILRLMGVSFSGIEKCYVNVMSFIDGKHSRRVLSKDGGYLHNNACAMPINHLVARHFRKPGHRFILALAEYLTQELIDAVGDTNFPRNTTWRF